VVSFRRRRAPRIVAVCTGVVQPLMVEGRTEASAIHKRPVVGPVPVGITGLAGDAQAEARFHGGPDRAVYAYATEDADHWVSALGRELVPGALGENLRTVGLDVSGARIGERWRTSRGVLLEVTAPRIPCHKLAGFLDVPDMVGRFLSAGRPGAYLRVLTIGAIAADDRLDLVARSDGPSVREVMAWRRGTVTTDELRRLATQEAAAADLRVWAREALALR
jgi:MOSC domain-containing protein YiiM